MKCSDCKWFDPDPTLTPVCEGVCRRLPPQFIWAQLVLSAVIRGIDLPEPGTEIVHEGDVVGYVKYAESAVWPAVEAEHWCGEFKPREIEMKTEEGAVIDAEFKPKESEESK
jgi:hypothetical protein